MGSPDLQGSSGALPRISPPQAEKKLKGFGFFSNKYEDAAEDLAQAANKFKLGKAWNDAADVYAKLADCYIKADSKHEAATAYVEGAKVAAKSNPQLSTEMLHKAVSLYTEMGRLNMAARQLKEIAEVNEKSGSKEEAITFYEQAADLFETEGSSSEATKCRWGGLEMRLALQMLLHVAQVWRLITAGSRLNLPAD